MGLLRWLRERFGPDAPPPPERDLRMHYVVAWVPEDEHGDRPAGWSAACGVFRPRRMTRVAAHATCDECREHAWVRAAVRRSRVR